MKVDELALVAGWPDTRATLRRWNASPWGALRGWAAGSLAVTLGLLGATWLVAVAHTPDPSLVPVYPGLSRPATLGDFLYVLGRNGTVLALHAAACVAGFVAGWAPPGPRSRLQQIAGPAAILFVVAATIFSLITQADALGAMLADLAWRLDMTHMALLTALAPHALPELFAVFLPLAAWSIASRRGAWHTTLLLAPSMSDSDGETSRLYTRWNEFVPALLGTCEAIGYRADVRQAWSHHNYGDVEQRTAATRLQQVRALLAGRWSGAATAQGPTVYVTEGGARLSRMASLYPAEDARQAQAKCLSDAWALHARDTGAGAGVAMLAQYLLYADVNFDCGLLEPYPSTVRRPSYTAWKGFPRYA